MNIRIMTVAAVVSAFVVPGAAMAQTTGTGNDTSTLAGGAHNAGTSNENAGGSGSGSEMKSGGGSMAKTPSAGDRSTASGGTAGGPANKN